ncbi:MAG: DUF6448 family protein [Verrucomicrobiia bacterium]|jgi:hypothetical protein
MKTVFRLICLIAATLLLTFNSARAHCDTMDGPVVTTAKAALEKGDVSPVLKWVKPEGEAEIRDAFKKTIAVRKQSTEAKELADRYFFETLVRVHRAGEGEPFTGLKPSGTPLEPGIAGTDKALEKGSVDDLVKELTGAVSDGVKKRFTRAAEAKKHADQNVESGREYVEAYVEFVHYVENLHAAAAISSVHSGAAQPEIAHHH